jgi:hypothetical protein
VIGKEDVALTIIEVLTLTGEQLRVCIHRYGLVYLYDTDDHPGFRVDERLGVNWLSRAPSFPGMWSLL